VLACVLAAIAAALALALLVVAYYMLRRVDYDGLGKLGFYGLTFAPQFFGLTLLAGLAAWLSYRRGARFATVAFGFVVALTAVMAIGPTVSQRLRASRYGVSVATSATFVPELMQTKSGRTVTYATSSDGKKLVLDVWRASGVPEGSLRPAIVFVHGGGEADRVVPAEQAELLEEAFEEGGAHLETYLFPWADHGFDFIWSSLATQTARETIRVFLGKYG